MLRYSTAVICAVFIATGAVSGEDQTKAVGDTVSFRPTNMNPPVTSIIWKHRSSSGVVFKVAEWDEDGFVVPNQRFKGITTLDEKTGQITITNLAVEHSGVYTIDINSKEQEQRFTLKVLGEDQTKAVGDTVSFHPANINPPVTSIIWKHRSSSGIVVKAIEWNEDGFNTPMQRFKGITTLDEKTGQITITNLTVEHSGVYTIDINSKEQEQRFSLKVLERVPKPVIKTEKIEGNPVVYLRCEYSEIIIWKNSAGETLIGSQLDQKGESIAVQFTGNPENFYTCTLDNGASTETSDPVYERDLFKDQGEMKAVGDTVSFRPTNINPSVTSIIWKHRSSSGIVFKVVEWDDDGFVIPNQRFKGITTLDEKTGQITITKLTVEHSGVYTIDINSKEQEQRFKLTVMEPVPKPE
ncbi:SLAM family member 7-like isoform X1 [Labeo rohita]|uniref:SLAM family member 7-like isoform X1 n=1 Tax=Labeo rohita TaxID=84645 RepID=A0A498NQ66_LABRO|nr:SLAM family member 7-like isoform X1 [Labeo rohita]